MAPNQNEDASTTWTELPSAVTTYLTAQANGRHDAVLSTFTADAVVTDEGHDHHGHGEIDSWLNGPASEFTYTTEFTSAATGDDGVVDVLQHLAANFPGGVADLHYRFALDGGLIRRLVIEP